MTATTYAVTDAMELSQVPSRYFHDAVVHAWLKTRRRTVRDGVVEIFQGPAECQLCRDVCKWVPSRFAGKSRTARQASVHFNDVVLKPDIQQQQQQMQMQMHTH